MRTKFSTIVSGIVILAPFGMLVCGDATRNKITSSISQESGQLVYKTNLQPNATYDWTITDYLQEPLTFTG
jgi:hypothetical protein